MLLATGLTVDLAVNRLMDLLPLLVAGIVGTAILEIAVYLFLKKVLKSRYTLPYTLVAPAAVALILFTLYPFVYNIRLAFSDLRLKTISCYIPNSEITNVPCSLSQAAPNADVKINVDGYEIRAEPGETADVAFALERGNQVRVTGKSAKIANYIRYAGSPLKINPDGTLSTQVCGADPICVRTFNTYKATVIDVQDERDWWPVRDKQGRTGWIPNQVYYAVSDADLYADSTGDEKVDAQVTQGAEVRLVSLSPLPTNWYQIELSDGQTGYVQADLVKSSQSFYPDAEATLYDNYKGEQQTVGQLAPNQELSLMGITTLTWYQVFVTLDQIGWVNVENPAITTIQMFDAAGDDQLRTDMAEDSEIIGSVTAGDELTLMATDQSTDVTWYQVRTAAGVEGWTIVVPIAVRDVQVFSVVEDVPLYQEANPDSATLGTLAKGTQVRVADHNTEHDITWRRVRIPGGESGWVNVAGETVTNFATSEDAQAFAALGARGGVLAELPKGTAVKVVEGKPLAFIRYRIRLADGTIGWVDEKADEVVTTERDPVLYSTDYGWRNFKRVFVRDNPDTGKVEGWGRLLQTQNSTFPRLMRTTVAWTGLNVLFHLIFGMMLALVLNRPGLRLRGIYRAIIILPWAIPQPIIALAWKGEFNFQFGFVNALLTQIGMERINWLFTPGPAFAAVTFVNIWLGIPFYMVTMLGGLQSIAGEYYEAAEIDGANPWQRFRHVTIPLIRPVAVPIITLDVIWTFNNFNVIYLITEGQPNEQTNILVTSLYNAAFGKNGQFQLGFAAAFSLVIFAVLFMFASVWVTSSGALKGVYES